MWMCRVAILLSLALAVDAAGQTETSSGETPETTQSAGEEATEVETAQSQDTEAQEEEQRTWSGIFSTIIDFFGREPGEALPRQGQEERPDADTDADAESEAEQSIGGTRETDEETGSLRTEGSGEEQVQDPDQTGKREPPPDDEEASDQPRTPPLERESDGGEVSTSQTYLATVELLAEIRLLREASGFDDEPGEPVTRENATLLDVYIKSRETVEKAARVQRRLGMLPVEVAPVPVPGIDVRDIHRNVHVVIEELRRVKRQLVVTGEIPPASLVEGVTPALVYKNLEHASSLLDALVGRPTISNEVYMHVMYVKDELALIAGHFGIALEGEPGPVEDEKAPREVAQQILRAVYKTINLQSRLGMDASTVPSMELEHVTPADAFNAANVLLSELLRIKVHLEVRQSPEKREPSRKKESSDTFAEVLLLLDGLSTITVAVNEAR